MSVARILVIMLALLMAGCGTWPETTEYFQRVTGLSLCEGAQVKNLNAEDPARSPGFDSTYRVHVTMSAECTLQFIDQLKRKSNHRCSSISGCAFRFSDNSVIFVEMDKTGLIITHST